MGKTQRNNEEIVSCAHIMRKSRKHPQQGSLVWCGMLEKYVDEKNRCLECPNNSFFLEEQDEKAQDDFKEDLEDEWDGKDGGLGDFNE